MQPNIDTQSILNQRAKQRGFDNLDAALTFVDSQPLQAIYIVLKRFNLHDLYAGVVAAVQQTPDLNYWYNKSWTKTIVLAGDPAKLNQIPFVYRTKNVGVVGPIFQESALGRNLTDLLLPLRTGPQNLNDFAQKNEGKFTISLEDFPLTLGKLVVQIVHTIAEVMIERKTPPGPPTLGVNCLPAEAKYTYYRIDGGLTEVDPFTLLATAVIV